MGYQQKNSTFKNIKFVFITYTLANKFLKNKDYEIVNSDSEIVAEKFSKKKKNIINKKSWEILNKNNTDFYKINCYDKNSFLEEFSLYAVPDKTDVFEIEKFIARTSPFDLFGTIRSAKGSKIINGYEKKLSKTLK